MIHSIGVSTQEGPHNLPIHNDGSPTTISPATWILRFHLAQYLITGKFPTVFHRLLGLKHRRDEETSPRVPVPPGTNKIIALLIALKGTASILRYALKWWTKRLALYLEDTESRMKVDHDQHADSQETRAEQQPAILATCAICRMTRMQPAVSKSCGHVFCWPCLNHWVSSVKEACPYCRAPCTLDDIQPLYNYDHATPSEESSNQNKIS